MIGVISGDLADGIAKIAVPTDKINCIGKIGPVSIPVTSVGFIFCPRFIHRLRIPVGRGRPRTRKETEAGSPSRFGSSLEL